MIKLTVENATDWSTTDLRTILLAGMKAHNLTRLHVIVNYQRKGSGCLGKAYVGHRRTEDGMPAMPACTMWLHLKKNDGATWKRCSCGGMRLTPSESSGFPCAFCRGFESVLMTSSEYAADVASTVDHECYHLRGLHHRNFPRHVLRRDHKAPWFTAYMKLAFIPSLPKISPSSDEKREAKLAHARSLHEKALTRLKRAQTIEKKWRAKVRGYERRQQMAALTRKES